MNASDFEPVIGLEIHAELETRSKMFCGCRVVEPLSRDANVAVCPVCLGLPGALPVINQRAVEMAILVGLALDCEISPVTHFARKNYFYPDLPKGYQISQLDSPIAHSGHVDITDGEGKPLRIRIRRAHLEEDTAKLLHEQKDCALVDFNRSSVPLLEIVTEPDMRAADAALAYGTLIRSILRYLRVNTGDMETGVLRFEANVSIRPRGSDELNTRTEIKNLNSFRILTEAINYEIGRQIDLVTSGKQVIQQTLGWDDTQKKAYAQRSKEEAHDYRYFPEPDLPSFEIPPSKVEQIRATMPELGEARYRRFQTQYQLSEYDAQVLSADRTIADFYEAALQAFPDSPKAVCNWMTGELFRLLKESGTTLEEAKIDPQSFAGVVRLVEEKKINASAGKEVLAEVFSQGGDPQAIVEARGLGQISDEGALAKTVGDILDAHPDQVAQLLEGKDKVMQWLLGQVMRATKGKASPEVARKLITAALKDRQK